MSFLAFNNAIARVVEEPMRTMVCISASRGSKCKRSVMIVRSSDLPTIEVLKIGNDSSFVGPADAACKDNRRLGVSVFGDDQTIVLIGSSTTRAIALSNARKLIY